MMLEDMGMSVRYPNFHHSTVNNDGSKKVYKEVCGIIGNRVIGYSDTHFKKRLFRGNCG
jgi:hypothetical protein